MRFVIKYTKRCKKLNERGIYNLQGLTSYGLYFKDELLNEFNNILFYDTIQSKSQSIYCTIKTLLLD
jgi:hypothetical protein